MPRPKKGEEKGANTPPVQFRLEPEVLAKLDEIAETYTAEQGTKFSRAAAVRRLIHQEHQRLTRRKGGA